MLLAPYYALNNVNNTIACSGLANFNAGRPLIDVSKYTTCNNLLIPGIHIYVDNVSFSNAPSQVLSAMRDVVRSWFDFYTETDSIVSVSLYSVGDVFPAADGVYRHGQLSETVWLLTGTIYESQKRCIWRTANGSVCADMTGEDVYLKFPLHYDLSRMEASLIVLPNQYGVFCWGIGGESVEYGFIGLRSEVRADYGSLTDFLHPRVEVYNGPWYT